MKLSPAFPCLALLVPLVLSSLPRAQQVVNVANVAGDDTASLTAALQSVGSGPATIQFAPGTYDFYTTPGASPFPAFALANKTGIVMGGSSNPLQRTILLFHSFDPLAAPGQAGAYPSQLFHFSGIDGLTFENLWVRMAREPYSSGIVKAKGGNPGSWNGSSWDVVPDNWIELEMEQAYSDLANGFQVERIDDFDPATRRLKSQYFSAHLESGSYVSTVVSTSPLKVRITANSSSHWWFVGRMANIALDSALLLMHSKYKSHVFFANACDDVVVRDVRVRDAAGMGVIASNCENVRVEGLLALPKADRLLSMTADGIHLQDCTGSIVVRNCDLRRLGDDGFNVHSKFLEVHSVSGNVVDLGQTPSNYWNIAWSGNQTIEFFAPNLQRRGTALMSSFVHSSLTATFSSALPAGLAVGDYASNVDRLPDSVLIEDTQVIDNIGHGLRLHGSNLLVEDCTFRRNTGPALLIETESRVYFETAPSDDVTIRGCVIDDSNRFTWDSLGALTVVGQHANGAGGPPPPACPGGDPTLAGPGLHTNIVIEGNTFTNIANDTANSRAAIWVTSTDVVHFNDNEFLNLQLDPLQSDENILRLERTTQAFSNGNNCVAMFGGTWFKIVCSQTIPPGSISCDW